MHFVYVFLFLLVGNYGISALIVPDDLPTLLSLIYSNIPTFKKGTDSRVGWGFRLGDRADFQVLVELGPQTNTQKLANQGDENGNNKRNTMNSLANQLYAQRYKEKQQTQEKPQNEKQNDQITNTDGGKFLEQWKKDVSGPKPEAIIETTGNADSTNRIPLGIGEVNAKDYIPDDDQIKYEELMQLYKVLKQYTTTTLKPKTTTIKPKTTTSYKDALDNVDLD